MMLAALALVAATSTMAECLPVQRSAALVRVVDGDTADIQIALGFGVTYAARVRLDGIDTPELHSPNLPERLAAARAKVRLAELLTRPFCLNAVHRLDKYGRILAVVYKLGQRVPINQTLIDERYARPYAGGKRAPW